MSYEAKHTPGPWRIEPGGLYVLATAGQYSDGEERTLMVAKVERHRAGSADRLPMDSEREANYRLIAAAPQMLKRLQGILADLEDFLNEDGEFDWTPEAGRKICREIEKTIQEATP